VLNVLQEKLGEAHGLAIAAVAVTAKVEERVVNPTLRGELSRLRDEAEETRTRCAEAERRFGEERATEILAHASATRNKAADLAAAWFKAGTGPIAAWTFLAMAEAAEVSIWSAVATLSARTRADNLAELARWALSIEKRHLQVALEGVVVLADGADPAAPRWG
jgi:hypothetical protein